jgi:hypothetical protein
MIPSRIIPLRIANLGKGLRYLGQVYGDPRDPRDPRGVGRSRRPCAGG